MIIKIVPIMVFLLCGWPGYALLALTVVLMPAVFMPAASVALLALVALGRLIAVVSLYRWSEIVEQLGKWVRIGRGIIFIVTIRVAGVARQALRIVGLSEGWTGPKAVVSYPAPTRQHEG